MALTNHGGLVSQRSHRATTMSHPLMDFPWNKPSSGFFLYPHLWNPQCIDIYTWNVIIPTDSYCSEGLKPDLQSMDYFFFWTATIFGFSFIFAPVDSSLRSTAHKRWAELGILGLDHQVQQLDMPISNSSSTGSVASQQHEREIRTLEVSRALHLQAGFHTFQDLWQLTVTRPTTFSSAEKGLP